MKEYNEQWRANRQSFMDWLKDGREPRHRDMRPLKDPRFIEQEERLAQKEPDLT